MIGELQPLPQLREIPLIYAKVASYDSFVVMSHGSVYTQLPFDSAELSDSKYPQPFSEGARGGEAGVVV